MAAIHASTSSLLWFSTKLFVVNSVAKIYLLETRDTVRVVFATGEVRDVQIKNLVEREFQEKR